ncbi:MAG: divergent polysaccharide deacetylase family protein [Treponema sp.]|nr:divergent polysaccharide deacetylase family protein [Treponema sp.]
MKNSPKKPSVPRSRKTPVARGKSGAKKPRKRRNSHTRRDIFRALALTGVLIAVSAFISVVVIVLRPPTVQQPETSAGPEIVPAPPSVPKKAAVIAPPETSAEPESAGTGNADPGIVPPPPASKMTAAAMPVVFVIDDAGNNLRELEPFLRFPGPLTIAVLPGLPYSAETARRIRAAGKEVFLHQPMEAVGGQNPGPGAIYSDMDSAAIRSVIRTNLAEIGPVAGMNNHQGSKITMDENAMETVLALCREEGIYFLDSITIAETAAPAAARRLGVAIGERDIFIDNVQERSSMKKYIEEGLAKAEQKGSAVMIGHAWSPELAPVLAEMYSGLSARGFSLSTMSRLMRDRKAEP